MDEEILLPNSEYIDISLGLKYLNANRKLYLKILNNFLIRYESFDINKIKKNDFKNEMHTLKGLSATLGMEYLSTLAKALNNEKTEENLRFFSETLKCIISDIKLTQKKVLLIIDDHPDDIDALMELLDNAYDIMVTTTLAEAIEIISKEKINLILLNQQLNEKNIQEPIKAKNISVILLTKPLNMTIILQKLNCI